MRYPLVSAIMPTRNRQAFIPEAIACFQAQTWPNKELIVIDDSDESVKDLIPSGCGFTYVRNEKVSSIGHKRNQACQLAQGDYVLHWDDDDWYGKNRIEEQVRFLIQSGAVATGYFYLPFAADELRRAWTYTGVEGYACGTTLCYRRTVWLSNQFPDVSIGEDNAFLERLYGRLITNNFESIVARVHSAGTSGSEAPDSPMHVMSRLEMLTSVAWTGGPAEVWQEIDYSQLALCGYPVRTTYVKTSDSAVDVRSDSYRTGRPVRAKRPNIA